MSGLLVKWKQRCATWRCGTKICANAIEKKPHHRALVYVRRSRLRQTDGSLIFGLMDPSRATLQFELKSVTLAFTC
jgi:hypothetical protein